MSQAVDAVKSATAQKAAPTLTLDEATHVYRLDGHAIPSVTQVLTALGFIDLEYSTADALLRGQRVHVATAYLDEGDLDRRTIEPEALDGMDIRGYVRAWERCVAETGCSIRLIEHRAYHPTYLYAGTIDRLVEWRGHHWIWDLKTVGRAGMPGPRWARFQTGGYSLLPRFQAATAGRPLKRASILLYPDGAWRPEFHDDFYDGQKFLAMLTTYRARLEVGVRDALVPISATSTGGGANGNASGTAI